MPSNCRMVSFRLSAAEYEAADKIRSSHGYRSMSIFARSATLAFHPSAADPYEAEMIEIRRQLDFLTEQIRRITTKVTT